MTRSPGERLSASERREAIVLAAIPLFAAKGFDAVTTRDVAEAAQISEALIYRHFESKTALHEAVLAWCVQRVLQDAKRIESLPDNTSTLVVAIYLVMRNIQLAIMPGEVAQDFPRLMLRSLLSDGAFARKFVQNAAAHWLDKVERCARVAIASGEIEAPIESAMLGFWFSHHLATSLVIYRLPGAPIVDYPVTDRAALFELSVRYALRGVGLTNAAIQRYYQPEAFALLGPVVTHQE